MKIKKNISKIIALSILLNNMCFYSNANSLSRYETLEGDVITLDNVESKDITEIEVFGNTVQDSNNLEDIQSVGDLYVDEQGEPILDKFGREQYKIEIESCNTNLFDGEWEQGNISSQGQLVSSTTLKRTKNFIFIYPSLQYIITVDSGTDSGWISIYDSDKKFISRKPYYKNTYLNFPDNARYIKFVPDVIYGESVGLRLNINTISSYTPHKSNKSTIFLPCQLMKVGNVYDRLYWDNAKGKYIVEKNIDFSKIEIPSSVIIEGETVIGLGIVKDLADRFDGASLYGKKAIVTHIPLSGWNTKPTGSKYGVGLYSNGNLRIYVKEGETVNVVEFQSMLEEGRYFYVYAKLKTPQLIESNLTEKIKLSTYECRSYISTITENGINPTLKLTVDRIEQASQEAVDIALSKPTYNNITLARMFINMLPESLYKDQLQAQLNELFSGDMVLDKKSASANLDLYIKSENILIMSLDTNTITFEDFSSTEDMEKVNAINLTVNSSLPYQVNTYLPIEIQNTDKSNTMNKDILNIKEHSEQTYKTFTDINEKVILKDNCPAGNNINHSIDLLLKGGVAHEKDVYKTTIKFEIEQK